MDYGINNKYPKVSDDEVYQILNIAYNAGVRTIDTAPVYGNAESLIGKYNNQYPEKNFKIITKVDLNNNVDWQKSLAGSLQRLNVPSVDTLLFHSISDYQKNRNDSQTYKEVNNLEAEINIGVSVYTNDELKVLIEDVNIQVVQAPFNLLDNEILRGQVFKELKDAGKTVHIRSVFLQGLFFMDLALLPANLVKLKPYLQELKSLSIKYELPIGAIALQYALSKDYIDGVLFGVESKEQLKTNFEWLTKKVDKNAFNHIDKIKINNTELLNPSNW